MEPIHGTRKASKFEPEDFISNMLDNVVTNVLDRLPLQDAVRTSILSRKWRCKWTMLSQLTFDNKFFKYILKTEGKNNYGRIISRLLLHLKGAITRFVLYIEDRSKLDDEDINHWILFLSKNGIKDLTIWKMNGLPLKLPTHLFACLQLKHLKLYNCCFDPPSSFHGFPNLLSLKFAMVQFKSNIFGEFITQCPLLEILNMRQGLMSLMLQTPIMDSFSVEVKLVEIAKLANLKILSLLLCNLDNMRNTSLSTIFELVGFLPKLQELDLDFVKCKFTEGASTKRLPTSFRCLKTLKFTRIDLGDGIMLSCAFEVIRCFQNLQTLEITAFGWDADPPPAIPNPIPELEYNTMGPLQLRNVVFKDLKGSKNEVCLIKYLLACSPFLKKIVIKSHWSLGSGEKLFARKLLKLHRASPVAEIDLY